MRVRKKKNLKSATMAVGHIFKGSFASNFTYGLWCTLGYKVALKRRKLIMCTQFEKIA